MEILFRGKRKDNGQWLEGSLISGWQGDASRAFIYNSMATYENSPLEIGCEVDPATVGQLAHKFGETPISGGDILRDKNGRYFEVRYKDASWWAVNELEPTQYPLFVCEDMELVGNIHDNPELLKTQHNQ